MLRLPLIALLVSASLSGCSAISAFTEATEVLDVYELRAPEDIGPLGRSLPYDVTVELPTTTGALDTDRMMIKPGALSAQYLPSARWGETVPVMVQSLILRSLQQTEALRYVGREPLGLSGDVAVVTDVIDFQAETAPDAETAEVKLRLSVQLVREQDIRILASRTFTATAPSASLDNADVVAAFDAASDSMMRDITDWIVGGLR